eukprot:TRINITY_DN22699_c0_g1_i4.p2 TRINITY_DN22699_c0_g1~~TRINITY_DN22699_c0_g1_i4.p2  ORF type:complete len:196 (+),score=36.17 TRINITY_DN22699_c0_g1_i4:88-675(+)
MDENVLEEEIEALESIYEDKFAKLDNNSIRIVIDPPQDNEQGNGESQHALYVVMKMNEDYPESIPEFDLSNVNNKVFPQHVRDEAINALKAQAEDLVGEMMVYTLVEFIRESLPEYNKQIFQNRVEEHKEEKITKDELAKAPSKTSKETDNMTKAQKRRYFDKFGTTDKEKPRGWDWVDIISHLSQRPAPPRTSA